MLDNENQEHQEGATDTDSLPEMTGDHSVDEKQPKSNSNDLQDIEEKVITYYKSKDLNSLVDLTLESVKSKRFANAEARDFRLELEKTRGELNKIMEENKNMSNSEIENLKNIIREQEQAVERFRQDAERFAADKAKLELEFACDKAGARDTEFVEYKLQKHLKSLSSDPEQLDSFNVRSWIEGLKTEHPDLFQNNNQAPAPSPAPRATSGLNNFSDGTTEVQDLKTAPISLNKSEARKVTSSWDAYKTQHGL